VLLNKLFTERLTEGIPIPQPLLQRPPKGWGDNGWYNHSIYNPGRFHFCSAIMREDLYDLGGFDERYAHGLGFDDNEFLNRILKKGMDVQMIDDPFVVHQHHDCANNADQSLMDINAKLYEKTYKTKKWDVKPFNTIYV
jgi:GT2 family glycosyltransferase